MARTEPHHCPQQLLGLAPVWLATAHEQAGQLDPRRFVIWKQAGGFTQGPFTLVFPAAFTKPLRQQHPEVGVERLPDQRFLDQVAQAFQRWCGQ